MSVEELLRAGRYDRALAEGLKAGDNNAIEAAQTFIDLRYLLRSKRYKDALRLLKKEPEIFSSTDAQLSAGIQAFDKQPSVGDVEPYLADPHLSAEAWVWTGLGYIREGQRDEAQKAFEQALEQDPGHPRAKINLANVHQEEGRYDEAIVLYEEVLKRDPDAADAHHNLAAAYKKLGRVDKSVSHFKRAQRIRMRPAPRDLSASRPDRETVRSLLPKGLTRWGWWIVIILAAYLLLHH